MVRNLKVLGLALVAVFALSAVVASAASAQNGTLTSTGPVTLIGTQTGAASANQLSAFGGTTTCTNPIYTGHKYNETPHKFIPNDQTTVTITPHYGPCTSKFGLSFPTTVDMNGCDYVFHLEGTTPGVDTYTIKATIVCPANQHITITIFSNAAKHTAKEPFCHITITENAAGYLGLHATETTPATGNIAINGEVKGIAAHKNSPTGSILCPEETTNTATLAQDVTVEGKNEAGTKTPISLSHL